MKLVGKTNVKKIVLAPLMGVSIVVVFLVLLRMFPQQDSLVSCALGNADLGKFVNIPGGGFVQGLDPRYPEEGPPRKVFVSPFRLLAHEVTNSQFAEFVQLTGYVTDAERQSGSAQFSPSITPEKFTSWWTIDKAATWRTPKGVGSSLDGRWLHPVIHVTLNDARAFAAWAGGRIPTEVEWEYAASLGLLDPSNPESGVRRQDGSLRVNIWTGVFPVLDSKRDGYAGTAPVGCYEPDKNDVFDMIGNVWEWTDTHFEPSLPRFTIKGGSYLCSEDYCQRYRPAAREIMEPDFSTSHIGFRIVKD
jgi:formylglycine-generating enzyme